MEEILDIYDENKNKTGKTIERKKKKTLNKGEYVMSVHCFIINSLGNILLTQRNFSKAHGGTWEGTGGAVKSGETSLEAIQRELEEEIGIDISEDELRLFSSTKVESKHGNRFRDIYVVYKDIAIEDICFSDGEVVDCKYVTVEKLQEMVEKRETKFKSLEGYPF